MRVQSPYLMIVENGRAHKLRYQYFISGLECSLSENRKSLYVYDFQRLKGDVNDLLSPVFLTLEPPNDT